MSVSKTLLACALLLFPAPAFAQSSDLSKDASVQTAGVYKMDPRHTSVVWKVMHMGASRYTARFNHAEGELDFNPADPTKSRLNVTIDPASVDTGSEDFNKEIAGAKFLGGDKNPKITFVSTSIQKTGAATGKVTGNLTLNGVTKPATLDVVFNGGFTHPMKSARDLGFSATMTIKRSDFNITQYIPMVADEVKIDIETEFLKDIPAKAK